MQGLSLRQGDGPRPAVPATARGRVTRPFAALVFYIVVPAMIGFPMGWYQAGLGRLMSVPASCGLWVCQWLVSWWVAETMLRLGRAILAPWRLPLIALLVIAAAANTLLSRFYGPALVTFFFEISGERLPEVLATTRRSLTDYSYVRSLVTASSYGALYWIMLRWIYERWTARPVAPLAAEQPVASNQIAAEPPQRLRLELAKAGIVDAEAVIALQAEDHYVRLHLIDGSRLMLCRFADLLADFTGEAGVQVHRSWWVRRAAIRDVVQESGAMRLGLVNGLSVPVSQKHRALVGYMLGRDPAG